MSPEIETEVAVVETVERAREKVLRASEGRVSSDGLRGAFCGGWSRYARSETRFEKDMAVTARARE